MALQYQYNVFSGTFDLVNSATGNFTVITTSSVIDDTNVTFVFSSAPTVLVINGAVYSPTGGSITWTGTTTVTLSSPVGISGSIFGIA